MVVGCQAHAPAAFTPRDIPGTHFHGGLGRPQDHGLVGRKYVNENLVTRQGIDPGTVRLVVQHYATPGPIYNYVPETNHVSSVFSVAAVLYLQLVLHVMVFRMLNMFCTFTSALPTVCVQCTIWLFFVFL
jgi:hypothetical protein